LAHQTPTIVENDQSPFSQYYPSLIYYWLFLYYSITIVKGMIRVNVLISGGTGFIGQAVVKSFLQRGNHVFVLTRKLNGKQNQSNLTYVKWFDDKCRPWETLAPIDVAVNLAGDPINKGRWTKRKKERILSSRIEATRQMIEILKRSISTPKVFISASAIGYYGLSDELRFDEDSPPIINSFLAQVCNIWEEEAKKAEELGVRTVIARIGLVLGSGGGVLSRMSLPYRLYIGGPVASGKQWISWIHINDLIALIHFIIDRDEIRGPINFTSPNPITMNDFGKAVGHALQRPHWFPVPSLILKAVFGEMSEILIEGQYVKPKKAIEYGYQFSYPDIDSALKDIL
jgi:uncharacterized protein (TIGR01777 family)